MTHKIIILCSLCLFCLNLNAINDVSVEPADNAGYILLDKLVGNFMQMAEKGSSVMVEIDKAVNNLMAEAKKAKAQGNIEPVFYKRYTRILMLLRLIKHSDPEGILWPIMEREIFDFVGDVKGEEVNDIRGAKGIVVFADAIAEEILNLRLYLDNREKRDILREEFKQKLNKAGFYQGAKVKD
jgi:hypothetical protein